MVKTIVLRQRKNTKGGYSLYLDYYIGGKRKVESLSLYLVPELSAKERKANRETLELANQILYVRKQEITNENDDKTDDIPFLQFYHNYWSNSATLSANTKVIWKNMERLLCQYCRNNEPLLTEISSRWVRSFMDFLNRQKLAESTKSIYFSKLSACLKQAIKREYIDTNPCDKVDKYKLHTTPRTYLTLEELKRLIKQPIKPDYYGRMFIFSCLTGLRWIDVHNLKWENVESNGNFVRLIFKQQKTGKQEWLDITPQAMEVMGERGKDEEYIFPHNDGASYFSLKLRQWAKSAGINKPLTYHTSRHTFAVVMLELGTDIYTLQKLMGHKDLASTQIYAEIVDKRKQDAISRIPKIL